MIESGQSEQAQQDRLREIQAKRSALAAAKAGRLLPSLDQQIETEQRALDDELLIERFETEVGPVGVKIAVLQSTVGVVVLKRPHRTVFKRFADKQSLKTEDLENLVNPCLLHPSKTEFNTMLDDQPALLMRAANACSGLAGIRVEEIDSK